MANGLFFNLKNGLLGNTKHITNFFQIHSLWIGFNDFEDTIEVFFRINPIPAIIIRTRDFKINTSLETSLHKTSFNVPVEKTSATWDVIARLLRRVKMKEMVGIKQGIVL
jgi:hypothetical protein